jgi:branched-chain amino acid transport system ATP-binding protein
MRALDIIAAEHRNMTRVARAFGALGERFRERQDPDDLRAALLIVDYFENFTERFHHPKEEDYLFARLELRSDAAAELLEKLHREHELSPRQLARIRELIAAGYGAADDAHRLAEEIASFRDHLNAHMRLEEETTFDFAREVLTEEDWREIDAAFMSHVDPLGHDDGSAEIAELRHRITQLLPAPEGLGGHAEFARPVGAAAPATEPAEDLLEIVDLKTRYGRIEALHGVSIKVKRGQLVALVGANGAGKTTLLRCISGVRPASEGTVWFNGAAITHARPESRVRAGICQVPEGRQVFGPMSIEDNLRMGAYTRPRGEISAALDEAYALFPILSEKRALPAGTLSGGQQQMLALGRALMGKPKLLLLDEPSMGLAPKILRTVFDAIRQMNAAGTTMLLVEQNARAGLRLSDHGVVMENGRVRLSGTGREVLENPEIGALYLGGAVSSS